MACWALLVRSGPPYQANVLFSVRAQLIRVYRLFSVGYPLNKMSSATFLVDSRFSRHDLGRVDFFYLGIGIPRKR